MVLKAEDIPTSQLADGYKDPEGKWKEGFP